MVVKCGLKIPSQGNCSASRVIPSSLSEWRDFQFAPNNHNLFFFLQSLPSTILFKLEHVLFYQFYAKITVLSITKCSVRQVSTTSSRHARGRLTPPHVRRKFPERVKIAGVQENCCGLSINNPCLAQAKDKSFLYNGLFPTPFSMLVKETMFENGLGDR